MKNQLSFGVKRGKSKPITCLLPESFVNQAEVQLSGDTLTWTEELDFADVSKGLIVSGMKRVPIEGCLGEFVRLANANPNQVLSFVRKWGVLAFDPLVESVPGEPGSLAGVYRFALSEPVFFYTRLARVFRCMLAVMRFLTGGAPVKPGELCDLSHVSSFLGEVKLTSFLVGANAAKKRTSEIYDHLYSCVKNLWQNNRPSIDIVGMSGGAPVFQISFKNHDVKWDRRRSEDFQDGLLRTLRPSARLDVQGDYPVERLSYQAYAEEVAAQLPLIRGGRRSPLLSVLIWQLLEAVTLPDDTYKCSQCGCFYPIDEDHYRKGRRPNPNKAHWCSQKHQDEWNLAYDSESKRKNK